MLSLLAATALGTSPHSPSSRYIVVSSNRDHAHCKGQQPFPWTTYVTAKENACSLWYQMEPSSNNETKAESNALRGFFGYKFHVFSSGIQVTTYTDAKCSDVRHVFDPSPFGECVEQLGITLDVVDFLPKPTPGMVLEKRCWASRSCNCDAPTYLLYQTSCIGANEDTDTPYDVEVDCEDGVQGYSSFRYKGYRSSDGSCTNLGGATEVFNNWKCTTLAPPHGATPFSSEAVWCGAECSAWKTLRTRVTAHARPKLPMDEYSPNPIIALSWAHGVSFSRVLVAPFSSSIATRRARTRRTRWT